MKKHENQLDDLLANILKEGALEVPENKQYTPALMAAIYAHDQKKDKIKQFIYGALGILTGFIIIASFIFLWQTGLLGQWFTVAKGYLSSLSIDLPLKFTPFLILAFLVHNLINGGFVVVYFLNRKQMKFS